MTLRRVGGHIDIHTTNVTHPQWRSEIGKGSETVNELGTSVSHGFPNKIFNNLPFFCFFTNQFIIWKSISKKVMRANKKMSSEDQQTINDFVFFFG